MMLGVDLPQPLPSDVSVNLGGRDARMAQQHLHDTKIGPMVEQMGCKGVAQPMR